MGYSSKPFRRKKEQASYANNEREDNLANLSEEYSDNVNGNFLNVDLSDSEFSEIKRMIATNNNLNSFIANEGFLKTTAISFLLLETDYYLSPIRNKALMDPSILEKVSSAQKLFQSFLDNGGVRIAEIDQISKIIGQLAKKLKLFSGKGVRAYILLSRAKIKLYEGISSIGDISKKIFKNSSTLGDITKFAVTTGVIVLASCGIAKLWSATGGRFLLQRAQKDIALRVTMYEKESTVSLYYNKTKAFTRSTVTNLSECGAIFRCIKKDGNTFLLYSENSYITIPHSANVVAVQAYIYSTRYSKLVKVEMRFPELPTLTIEQGGEG